MTTLVFVHGWSVTSTATYGLLPKRLRQQADAAGMALQVADIWLSEYVSFDDSVTMADLVRAFDHALRALKLGDDTFACITHSFGGPVIREWLRAQRNKPGVYSTRRLTHLVMLAPANYGSALAQLGKGTLGKLKAWWSGVQPGQHLLDWMELGSAASVALSLDLIHGRDPAADDCYQFVLTGDRPDRKLYDQLIPYTGEDGSDGVVRIASANLNARHVVLAGDRPDSDRLASNISRGPRIAFRIIPDASHSGDEHGIMAAAAKLTVTAILQCLGVQNRAGYLRLCDRFDKANAQRDANKVELEPVGPFSPRVHIHDPCSMLIVRLTDETGVALDDARFLLTAGKPPSADFLPQGFMLDRQGNSHGKAVTTMFLDYSLLAGDARVADPRNSRKTLRAAVASHRPYGAQLQPADLSGLVHHAVASTLAGDDLLDALGAHQTTVLDVVLPRKVHEGVFRLTRKLTPQDFGKPVPGAVIP